MIYLNRWSPIDSAGEPGFWNPSVLKEGLDEDLKIRVNARQQHYSELKNTVLEFRTDIRNCFLTFCDRLSSRIKELDAEEWKYADIEKAGASWDKWYELLENKIKNLEFFHRIICGITSVPTPDVWNDPLCASEFEESFCESLLYLWSKEYTNETSNLVASAIANKVAIQEDCDAKTLVTIIDKFLSKNVNTNLFE